MFPFFEKETETIIAIISYSLSREILCFERILLALQQLILVLKYLRSSISCRSAAYMIFEYVMLSFYSGYVSNAFYVSSAILRACARP